MAHSSGAKLRSKGYLAAGVILSSAILAFGLSRYWPQPAAEFPRWNVMLITLDTTRPDRLGCYGYLPAHTPAIDRLNRNSVRYERCYTPVPLTLPAHCSLMTGLDPPRHGIHTNRRVLSTDAETLSEILNENGYATGAVVGAFVLDRRFGLAQGYDTYDDDMSKGNDPGRFNYIERNAAVVTDAALKWWNKPHDRPKFLWVHYFDAHSPYSPAGFDPATSPLKPYDAENAFVDRHLARLLSKIESEHSDTLVVLTADHGEGLGEHGEYTHGLFAYDATLRVPLVVRFPDRRAAGKVVTEPVSLVDVTPSLLNWLGLPALEDVDGRCLPLPGEPTPVSAEPRTIFFENEYIAKSYGWSPLRGVVAGDWKLIEAPRPELYDLASDPRELENRFESNEPRSRKMSDALANVLARQSQLRATPTTGTELDELSVRKLRSLGYVSETTKGADDAQVPSRNQLPDPKDMVGLYDQVHTAMSRVNEGQVSKGVDLLVEVIDNHAYEPPSRAVRTLAALVVEDRAARQHGIPCLKRMTERSNWQTVDRSVYESLGVALSDEGRYPEAIQALRRLVNLNPEHAAAYYLLGGAYRKSGDSVQAAAHFKRAIQLAGQADQGATWLGDAERQVEALRQERQDTSVIEPVAGKSQEPL